MISIIASNNFSCMMESEDPDDDETLQSVGLQAQNSPTWVAFNNMLALPYFSRVWIVQEIAVAKSGRITWGSIIIPMHAVKNAAMLLVGNHQSKDWSYLVVRFMGHEASDPRDEIYAFIGLADQTGYDIVADYNKPVLEVYQDFVRKTIAVTGKLDILRFSTV
ncbi:hypothetical protein LB505_010722 [Fusarium chuoi]|nr:hypothetical protein LB505_010722 [Fusarium chuoi]